MTDYTRPARVSIAPMMDWTDRHCRYFMRLLSPSVHLYTEMVTAAALKHGDAQKLLQFELCEHPIALQIGGSDPKLMAEAAKLGADKGYDEININVGCPSDRVQSGQFGACLMSQPDLVAACVGAMKSVVDIPVTIKTRIGIDDHDDYGFLRNFVIANVEAGCSTFIVHARKAILAGLSPKENRLIPPLNYDRVYRLKQEMPEITIILNGGVASIADCQRHLEQVDGVMVGRQAYQQPWFLTELEQAFGNGNAMPSRHAIVRQMLPYIEKEMALGAELKHITRHMLGLYAGQPGARAWRRYLSEHAHRIGGGIDVLETALTKLPQAA
ncbi:MAG: tRNA dihydrouridine(20/20a) synthase DusA [Proteobacteria bacterium]|nr:tRNA dihydrouridine(20/20a) synthase DusA [Pseudomonadota bacterium]MDA0994189.1 tRNA dihydrouridine(20/20a) synthase DusA [Pseudomonadota bacterium]